MQTKYLSRNSKFRPSPRLPAGTFSHVQLIAQSKSRAYPFAPAAAAIATAGNVPPAGAGPERALQGTLGNTTDFASQPLKQPENEQKRLPSKVEIWRRLRIAKRVLGRESRVSICQTHQTPRHKQGKQSQGVTIIAGEGDSIGYEGLFSCENVWACPVCATRAARRRQEEIVEAMERHRIQGGKTYLATYTFRHNKGDNLKEIVRAMREASRTFKSGRWYKVHARNVVGTIVALETTWGANGFHPHSHELLFTTSDISENEVQLWREHWIAALTKEGLSGEGYVAFDLREATPSGYLLKEWGADSELIGGASKMGAGLSPLQILDRAETDERFAALYRIFVDAFAGRSRLRWSKGLRKRLGIVELQETRERRELGTLSRNEWGFLVTMEWEGYFLDTVRFYGFSAAYGAVFLGIPITADGT